MKNKDKQLKTEMCNREENCKSNRDYNWLFTKLGQLRLRLRLPQKKTQLITITITITIASRKVMLILITKKVQFDADGIEIENSNFTYECKYCNLKGFKNKGKAVTISAAKTTTSNLISHIKISRDVNDISKISKYRIKIS